MQTSLVILVLIGSIAYLFSVLLRNIRGKSLCTSCTKGKKHKPQILVGKTLSEVKIGENVRITCLQGRKGDCHRLRELGLCENECITKISDNGALICSCNGTRVIISKNLAKNILVEQAA